MENATSERILRLRDDKGGEYMSLAWARDTDEQGIWREHTAVDTPHQNGVAERFNRTAVEAVRTMMFGMKAPKSQWGNAFLCYIQAHNCFLTSAVKTKTPDEAFFKAKPDVSRLAVFWSKAHVWTKARDTLEPTARECRFIGYEPGVKAWRFEVLKTGQKIVSQHAIFYEVETLIALTAPPLPPSVPQQPAPPSYQHGVTYLEGDEDDIEDGLAGPSRVEGDRTPAEQAQVPGPLRETEIPPPAPDTIPVLQNAGPAPAVTPPAAPAQQPQARSRATRIPQRRSKRLKGQPASSGSFRAAGKYWETANLSQEDL